MSFSKTTGTVTVRQRIVLKINKELFEGRVEGSFSIENIGYGTATIKVQAENKKWMEGIFVEADGYNPRSSD